MKKISRYSALAAVALSAMMMACSVDFETSDNGHLDGYWHMTAIDTIATGGIRDLSHERLFWAFQSNLLDICNVDNTMYHYLLRFNRRPDSLLLSEPCFYDRMNPAGDVPLSSPDSLRPFGINHLNQGFRILHIGSGTMMLSSDSLIISFKKL